MSLSKLYSSVAAGVAYPGHRHFTQRLLSRRGFLEKTGLTAGALAAAGLVPEVARSAAVRSTALTHGRKSTTAATPLPIPGGLQPLGPSGPLFHIFLPAPGVEPSTITNFNGFIGWGAVGVRGRTLLPARLLSIFPSKPTFASCKASTSARTDATTTARSRSYDLMYSQVPRRTCKFTISILGPRKADCSGRSQFPITPFR